MKKSSIIFYLHCLVALIGHLFLIVIPIGVLKLYWNNYLDIWTKGLILGCLYLGLIYIVNHIGSGDIGFCLLTDWENYLREKEGLPKAPKRFVPRFYGQCNSLLKKLFRIKDK